MAPMQYTSRNNAECKRIHQNRVYKYDLITGTCPLYQYELQAMLDSSVYGVDWERRVLTYPHIPNNKPGVLLVGKTGRFAYIKNLAHNYNNYEPLVPEIKEICRHEKIVVVPIILPPYGT